MKHFLKPLGHCLTTAVMTSAMLRVYAIPPVEAATPDDPQPSSDTATAEGASALAASTLSGAAPVALPEVIGSVESAPTPEPAALAVDPVAVDPITPDPVAPDPVAPANEQTSESASELMGEPTNKPADAPVETPEFAADPKPGSPDSQSIRPPTVQPDAAPTPSLGTEADAKEPLPSTQKPAAETTRTIAGMRQIVEKRLETITRQDKEIRDAKWQQNLIQVALDYARHGKFETARQVAANPALSLELQISLLGEIAAIETQFFASQVTPSFNAGVNQPQSRVGQSVSQGRNLPSSYSTVNGLATLPGYEGVGLYQCPIVESPPSQAIASPQPARPTATAKAKTTGVPDFVPALGQNLASRLARLSQTQRTSPAVTATQPVVPPALVSPQLFAGVAVSSVRVQPSPVASLPITQPKVTQPKAAQPKVTQPAPILSTAAQASQAGERQFSERLFPAQPTQPQSAILKVSTPKATANNTNNPKIDANSEPQATLPFGDGQPFVAFPEFFDNPLDWVWNWWNLPSSQETEPFSAKLPARSESQIAATSALSIAAELGLTSNLLFQTIEQDLTGRMQPLRNARKLSISLPSVQAAALKAPLKAPASDPSALLAISCSRAQLAPSLSHALINPATAKQFGWVNFMFPLPIPAVITSAFGWRTHPISGDLRFHTGLDIGAPMGTPVLSAAKGQVVVADTMGGYGLAVVVEDETTHQRNLYAHLSGIAVQPGATVEQGTVLGWVGSTGNSTGPHLHFEAQVKTENGWTVIDPLASAAVAVAQGQPE